MDFIKEYWNIIVYILELTILPTIGYFIGKYKKSKKETSDAIEILKQNGLLLKGGVQTLLKQSLQKSCIDYIERGYCPVEIKNIIGEAYDTYKDLDGDGLITNLVSQINALPNSNRRENDN